MNKLSKVVPAMYFVAAVLIVIPVFDAITSVYPFYPGNAQWRFAIVGLLSNALLLPTIGLLMAVVIAVSQEHERMVRWLRFLCWGLTGVMAVILLMFMLDTAQSKSAIQPQMLMGYYVATATAMCKLLVAGIALVLFARGCSMGEVTGRAVPFRR
ncbi:MAG: hypothetical protein JWM95_2255 [Gemmatimonadetes bacterium]|nr:hypothetical protein [Gemmatimonadota bacterium]